MEVLGRARVRLRLDADKPRGTVIVRVCDVAPDGASTLVTRGVLNLGSRQGRDRSVPWKPGTPEDVEVELTGTGYAFPAGHRIREAVSIEIDSYYRPLGERMLASATAAEGLTTLIEGVFSAETDRHWRLWFDNWAGRAPTCAASWPRNWTWSPPLPEWPKVDSIC